VAHPHWFDGYTADTPYTAGYHPAQSPTYIGLTCAVCDVAWAPPDREALTVIDLGCGRGVTACTLAAANPGWRVVGVDFQPAHIGDARALAAEAGLENATFLELDLTRMDEAEAARLLPQADVITAHGLWTWVSDAVRAGILAALRACLVNGGAAMISYNAMPGWSQGLAVARLIRAAAAQRLGPSNQRAAAAIETLRAFHQAEAHHLQNNSKLEWLLTSGVGNSAAYVAHEYLPRHWRPAWAGDVHRDLAEARLDFVGSCAVEENFPSLLLTEQQREAVALIQGPERETAIDICIRRTFRQDVFVRGRRRDFGVQRLRELRLALLVARERVRPLVRTHVGEAALPTHVADPVLDALAERPRTVGELLALPGTEKATVGEIVAVLVGGGWAMPLWRDVPAPDSAAAVRARRFNRAVLRRHGEDAMNGGGRLGLVVPAAGCAHPCPADELAAAVMLQSAVEAGEPSPDIETLLDRLMRADATGESRSGFRERLAARLPGWRAAGVL
jgi:SAM-dependent methyltransferase